VCPDLTRRVPTICVLLTTLFQECISNFAIYMFLLQDATITEQNMRIHTLESSGLTKHEELIMYKVVLNSVQFVDVIYTNETFRTEGREENVLLR
jgi:hypothetical protein